MPPRPFGGPVADQRGSVGRGVFHDEMDIETARDGADLEAASKVHNFGKSRAVPLAPARIAARLGI